MANLKQLLVYIKAAIYWGIYLCSLLIPKDKKVWVFVGWRTNAEREIFAENPKYLYLHVQAHEKSIRPIWIGKDEQICALLNAQGYEAYPLHSFKGVFYSLRARYTIIGAFLNIEHWKLSGGSKVVQLWHGKSVKKTGHNSPYSLKRYRRFTNPNLFTHFYKFVAISDFLAEFVVQDFHIPKEELLVSGIPKQDALIAALPGHEIDLDTNLNTLVDSLKAKHPHSLFFYGPTFRPNGTNPLPEIDLGQLNETLKQQNDFMVISLHPKFSTKDWIPEGVDLSNIFFSQGDTDIYPILHKFDALITDYSSLAMDFLYMGKPVILYAYDLHTYEKDMGVYEEIWEVMPGPKVFTFPALLETIQSDSYLRPDGIKAAQNTLFTYTDAGASSRIVAALK